MAGDKMKRINIIMNIGWLRYFGLALALTFVLAVAGVVTSAAEEQLGLQVLSGGGAPSSSTDFRLNATIGQSIIGMATAPPLQLGQGFWFGGKTAELCCQGTRGNVFEDGHYGDVNVLDVTRLVDWLFLGQPTPECLPEANVNGDSGEIIDLSDLTYLVAYLFGGGPEPPACP